MKNLVIIRDYFDLPEEEKEHERFNVLRHLLIYSEDLKENEQIRDIVGKVIIKYPEFLKDPASAKCHGSYAGGLFDHSLHVYEHALEICNAFKIPEDKINFIACFFHDLCKVGKYIVVPEFKRNYTTIQYEYNPNYIGIEHGAESLRRLLMIEKMGEFLPEEWQMAIAYHMGVFGVSNTEMKNFSTMSEKFPEVLLLHHADMMATKLDKC